MSLYQTILAHLSALPTQQSRLVRLHTPLGPNALVVEHVDIDEAIGPAPANPTAAYRAIAHVFCGDAHLQLKTLMGQPVLLELLLADGSLRPWSGHITSVALLGSDGGLARYRLTIEPWLAFLSHRQDSYVFQNQTVMETVDEIFKDYAGQATLQPQWRWELADTSVYTRRSLNIQYNETDLAFIERLLLEEGLFYWWEHSHAKGQAHEQATHTLVIADHNGAFPPNAQPVVRFTQSSATLKEDSLTHVQTHAQVRTASLALASADYRTLSLRPQIQSSQSSQSKQNNKSVASNLQHLSYLQASDIPGQYAYEDHAQGERLLRRQMQALDAQRLQAQASGSYRCAAAATHFTLTDHPVHTGTDLERDQWVILRAQHQARNNIKADHQDKTDNEQPIYQCQLHTQALAQPVRMANTHHPHLHPSPTITGVQTAVVVGLNTAPVHTDRDQRIKVQFHWQRGQSGSHRLPHPTGQDNAPTSDASGTWVRVATPIAGQNWGSIFTPRLGQEVLIAFMSGDIDRPTVIGSLYNGQGQADAQGNQIASGGSNASGNAPAWFAGHQHNAVLSGIKSQELPSSQQGSGGHNQLVFDDSPSANRIEMSTTQAATHLQMGHLLNQNDNQRLGSRGHGLELATQAWGALRAGSGLLISAHGKAASTLGNGQQMDSTEPLSRLQSGQDLLHTLAQSAQDHQAKLAKEPSIKGASQQDTAKQLPAEQALWATQNSLKTKQTVGDTNLANTGGGQGSATAWERPDLVLAAPAGIIQSSPQSGINSAGNTTSAVAGQDINQLAVHHWSAAAKDGMVLYTYGKISNPQKPNKETGIQMHAASGNVNSQSQSGATHVAADQAVSVSSTSAGINVSSPRKILLAAGGAGITIQGGGITLSAPGSIKLKAGHKVFAGGGSVGMPRIKLNKPKQDTEKGLSDLQFCFLDDDGQPHQYKPYVLIKEDGQILEANTDGEGKTLLYKTAIPEKCSAHLLSDPES